MLLCTQVKAAEYIEAEAGDTLLSIQAKLREFSESYHYITLDDLEDWNPHLDNIKGGEKVNIVYPFDPYITNTDTIYKKQTLYDKLIPHKMLFTKLGYLLLSNSFAETQGASSFNVSLKSLLGLKISQTRYFDYKDSIDVAFSYQNIAKVEDFTLAQRFRGVISLRRDFDFAELGLITDFETLSFIGSRAGVVESISAFYIWAGPQIAFHFYDRKTRLEAGYTYSALNGKYTLDENIISSPKGFKLQLAYEQKWRDLFAKVSYESFSLKDSRLAHSLKSSQTLLEVGYVF